MTNNALVVGEKYLGELLKVDYGMQGLNDESWYVVLKNGEVKEVEE